MQASLPLFRLTLLGIGLAFTMAVCGLVPLDAQQMHRNLFESNHTSWIKSTADTAFEETNHTMSDQVAHEGQRSEYILINAKQGTHVYYYYQTAKAPIAEDLTASIWVKSNRSGIQLLARLVLPKEADPTSREDRLVVLLRGDTYKTVGAWKQLEIGRPVKLAKEQQQIMQTQFNRPINFDGAYIDKLVLNVYGGPGVTDVWIDELEIGPVFETLAPKDAGPTANAPTPAPGTARPTTAKTVAVRGSNLEIDGKPFFFLGVRHTTTAPGSLAALRNAGINALFVDYPWNPEALKQAVDLGFWLVPTLPVTSDDARFVSADGLAREVRNFPEPDSVLFWNLGNSLAFEQTALVDRAAKQIMTTDRQHVSGCDAWDGLARYSTSMPFISVHRWPLETTMELTQYRDWMLSRASLTNPGTFLWTWIQTHTPEWYTQVLYNKSAGGKFTEPIGPQPEQVRLLTYLAVGSGVRGIGYWSDQFLDKGHQGTDRLLTVALLNQELEFLEPMLTCAEGSTTWVPTSDANVQAAVIRTSKGLLVLPMWLGGSSQFVPGQAAVAKLTLTVPLVPPSFQAWELSPGDVRSLKVERGDKGGMTIVLPEFGLTTAVAFTSDIKLIQHFQDLCFARRQLAAQYTYNLAVEELTKVAVVEEQLEKQGHTLPDSALLLKDATDRMKTAHALWEGHQFSAAYREAQRALRPARIMMRAQWDKAQRPFDKPGDLPSASKPLDSPVASPYGVSFYTLAKHWEFMDEVQQATPKPNVLPTGDFEVVPGRAQENWAATESTLDEVEMQHKQVAEFTLNLPANAAKGSPKVLAAKEGKQCLLLEIKPKAGPLPPPKNLERTYLSITSPTVKLPPGSLVRISAWMCIPDPIQASADGALFYDSAGGEPLAIRVAAPTAPPPPQVPPPPPPVGFHKPLPPPVPPPSLPTWKQYTLYRRVPASGTINVTLALTGMGRVAFDDVRIEPLVVGGANIGNATPK
jgi:hypothetical protein